MKLRAYPVVLPFFVSTLEIRTQNETNRNRNTTQYKIKPSIKKTFLLIIIVKKLKFHYKQINNETIDTKKMYLPNKHSGRWFCTRHQDNYTNLGYDYHGHIYEKTLSPVIFLNKKNRAIMSKIEPMIEYMIDKVKQIRLQLVFSLDKNDTRIN